MWVFTRTRSKETTTWFLYRERAPYISAKKLSTHVTLPKSPTHSLKSPLYPQDSLKCLQKRSVYPQKSPKNPQKSPVHLSHQVKKVVLLMPMAVWHGFAPLFSSSSSVSCWIMHFFAGSACYYFCWCWGSGRSANFPSSEIVLAKMAHPESFDLPLQRNALGHFVFDCVKQDVIEARQNDVAHSQEKNCSDHTQQIVPTT